jgi:hypothetical protein
MLAKSIVAGVIGCAVLTTTAYAAPARRHPAGINAREHRQVQRIKEGNKNGELTAAEKDKLKADEAAVRAEERVYRQSGNGLNARERRDLEHDLNKTSREIYRAKHNERKPQ